MKKTSSTTPAALRHGALACAAALLAACGGGGGSGGAPAAAYRAEIRRTAHGIPHIEAANEKGIGYGVGYAYAQDNFCLLAEHFVTVRGESARYFGEGAPPPPDLGTTLRRNVVSDFFYRAFNDDASARAAWAAHSADAQDLLRGFARGYNRYLQEQGGRAGVPAACRGAPWVRPVDELDMARLVRDYAFINGLVDLAPYLAETQPHASPQPVRGAAPAPQEDAFWRRPGAPAPRTGSNGIALGGEATDNGRGMVLGQPHFPWIGVLRMYQLHVTIPGRMDAMGATLPGMPVVGIGFTRDFAWTHTTNTVARTTLHQLRLDPRDATRYLVDGQSRPMERRTVHIEVLRPDGRVETRARDFYASAFGPLVALPGRPWSGTHAYAVRDVNSANHRMVDQWLAMNRAGSLGEFKSAVQRIVGNPWNNTLAADAQGRALYLDATPAPRMAAGQRDACAVADLPDAPDAPDAPDFGPVWRGDTARCQWTDDPAAPQPGIFAGRDLPALERRDYVHNANDSAWLSNPHAPLTGFSPLVSIDGTPQNLRTRYGLHWLETRLRREAGGQPTRRIALADLQALALDNHAYLADLVLDDLLAACPGGAHAGAATRELAQGCEALRAWDRTANLDAGVGYGYMEAFAQQHLPALDAAAAWRVPFDPADPVHTPRGLRVEDPAVAAQVRAALVASVQAVDEAGWMPGQRLGDVQGVTRGARRIPLHGGAEEAGVYNAAIAQGDGTGAREVLYGSSYLQAVGFEADGPRARALLAYSQSTDPASPYFADQTEKYARREWVDLPFTRAAIDAQARGARTVIAE